MLWLVLVGLLVGTRPAPALAATMHAVDIVDFAFSPATLTIAVGDTVTWTNRDSVAHTATGAGFDSGDLAQGASYSVTFTAPGTYDYLCTPHPTMTGRVIVQAAASPSTPPGTVPDVAMQPMRVASWSGMALISTLAALFTLPRIVRLLRRR